MVLFQETVFLFAGVLFVAAIIVEQVVVRGSRKGDDRSVLLEVVEMERIRVRSDEGGK
jgi:hypothetical protein